MIPAIFPNIILQHIANLASYKSAVIAFIPIHSPVSVLACAVCGADAGIDGVQFGVASGKLFAALRFTFSGVLSGRVVSRGV
jgi:hypothetical protein